MAPQTPIGPGFTIRQATNEDGEAVRLVVASVLDEYGLSTDPGGTDSDLSDIETNYMAAGGTFEVIESGGRVVGTWGLYPQNREVCELRKMYLLPEVRGQGLGQEVLVRALDHARSRGFWRVELETAEVLREAIGLYRKFGFRPVTSEHLSARCDQAYALDLRDD